MSRKLEKAVNMESKNTRKSYKLAERRDHVTRSQTLITLKDHKVNFLQESIMSVD